MRCSSMLRQGSSGAGRRHERFVVGRGTGQIAVLLLGDREPHLRLQRFRIERAQLQVGLTRRLTDDTVLQHDGRARKAGEPLRQFPQQLYGALERVGSLLKVAGAHVDRRQHVPAAPVVGMVTQMRLDLGNEVGGARLLDRHIETRRIRAAGQRRRADGEIDADC